MVRGEKTQEPGMSLVVSKQDEVLAHQTDAQRGAPCDNSTDRGAGCQYLRIRSPPSVPVRANNSLSSLKSISRVLRNWVWG